MNFKTLSVYAVAFVSVLTAISGYAATDITVGASTGCKVGLGEATNPANGSIRATTTVVIHCPMHKAVGSNKVNFVFARIKNGPLSGYGAPGCSIITRGSFGEDRSFTYGPRLANHKNPQSQQISVTSTPSIGYMSLSCILSAGDEFYGFRYGQD